MVEGEVRGEAHNYQLRLQSERTTGRFLAETSVDDPDE